MENNPKTNVEEKLESIDGISKRTKERIKKALILTANMTEEEKHALYIETRKAELAGLKARLNYYNQLKNNRGLKGIENDLYTLIQENIHSLTDELEQSKAKDNIDTETPRQR